MHQKLVEQVEKIQECILTKFDDVMWGSLIESVVVNSSDDIILSLEMEQK